MSAAEALVRQMTLGRWLQASTEERAVVTDALHDVVPRSFTLASIVGHQQTPVPFFVHEPTQLGFFLVFGERFMMGELGADAAREQADRAARDPEAEYLPAFDLAGPLASMQPVREVQVAPFFLAEDLIDGQWQSRFELTQIRGHENFNRLALERLAQHGWRLPSEAEVELTRLLPQQLRALGRGWCQDTWHPNYVGAPLDARPWGTDATLEVDGLRKRFDLTRRRACVRAARSLFAEPAPSGG